MDRRLLVLSTALLLVASTAGFFPVQGQGSHTYYGHVPADVWSLAEIGLGQDVVGYRIDNASIRTNGTLFIVGSVDGTRVEVYTLPDRRLLTEFQVDKLRNHTVYAPNGTFFKVVSDKAVQVEYLGSSSGDQLTTTFFTSTTGGYVGREFVVQGVQSRYIPGDFPGMPYRIYALEDGEVTVTDAAGNQISSQQLKANKFVQVSLAPGVVYRIASTGYVMVQSFFLGWGWSPQGTAYYPSATGGFLGKRFYGSGIDPGIHVETWASFPRPEFVLTSTADSKISITDIDAKRKYGDEQIAAASNLTEHIKVGQMAIESDQPVMLMLRNFGMSYTGLAAGQNAYVYIPTDGVYTGEAYLFAYKETTVTVDDVQSQLRADESLPLTSGYHRISATENVVIQVANWPRPSPISYSRLGAVPEIMRLSDWAVSIPSAESMSLTYTDLSLKPVLGEELPLMYIAAGAVAAVIVVVVVVALRRGKKS